jgi:hypothetical protein
MKHCNLYSLAVLVFSIHLFSFTSGNSQNADLIRQTQEEANRKSEGCLSCHVGIEPMHKSEAVKLGCVDCHGGNAQAKTIAEGHVKPKFPDRWKTSANPIRSYTLLNEESPEFIKFVNPGDLRIADETCGPCHSQDVLNVKKSMMTTSPLLWGGAAYQNGIVSSKHYFFGESYSRDGIQQIINQVPPPTEDDVKRGVLPFLAPLPRWEITQVTDKFRAFEKGGKFTRINPSDIGIPNPLEDPGRPDMKLTDRAIGTQLSISSPVLNIHKTRLNDPHLSFMGTNDHPGDFRSSGCTGCHVIYANDRSPIHSGPYAAAGNIGKSQTQDKTINKYESGHPIKHQFTNSIPSSQCMVCHMHQPNAFVNTYFGYQMWDYESDGDKMYPKDQFYPDDEQKFALLKSNPEEAVLRGNWGDSSFLASIGERNNEMEATQFADYHGHGWLFRAVFSKDRKGNLLDSKGNTIPWESEHKFHGVVPIEDGRNPYCNEECRNSQKAVHLNDIHAEKGMHCIDCHFKNDNHGDGNLYGEFHNAIEITCIDCHGTISERASLRSSGPPAVGKPLDFEELYTPNKERRFVRRGNKIIQRSMIHDTLTWEIPQLKDIVDPNSANFNAKARQAKMIMADGYEWDGSSDSPKLAHSSDKIECYACHSSWVTNCFGCHLPQQANWKKEMNHFEGETSRNWTTYNPQVVRDDAFMLCVNATTKGNKVAPARSSSALVLSSRNANREQIYIQQPPISAPGYSSQAFNPHVPHTVRTKETKQCVDCHLSKENNNNAWMAQVLLQGTNTVNFMGKYVYVGTGSHGIEAVAVTESDEPQAVVGSYLQKLAYPDYYDEHLRHDRELQVSHHHPGTNIRSLQLRGEYLYTASGTDGFRVFDVANIDNKGYSERIVTAPVSEWGQDTHVKTANATAVALPTNMPIDTRREYRPENEEQWPIHPSYSYAYITDYVEGLILVDVMNLVDGDPTNNFLKRSVTFNPDGALDGAVNLTIAGNFVYVCCKKGVVIVDISNPLKPSITSKISPPTIINPRSIAIQFRYAFVCDNNGLSVIDVTFPEKPRFIKNNTIKLKDANDVYVARTYAYVAAGSEGLAIIDATNPEKLVMEQMFTSEGNLNDARAVKVASTNASIFAYLADGHNGLKVIQLTSPETTPGFMGFSATVTPKLIATRHTHGEAVALSKGMDRDRAVDESGNQVSIFGRLGSRPFTLEEQRRMFLKDGKIWTVTADGKVEMDK